MVTLWGLQGLNTKELTESLKSNKTCFKVATRASQVNRSTEAGGYLSEVR